MDIIYIKVLYKLGILKMDSSKLKKWNNQGNYKYLTFASENGSYITRYNSIVFLKNYYHVSSVRLSLHKMIDDPLEFVSERAMEIIEKITDNENELLRIESKRAFWENYNIEKKRLRENYNDLIRNVENSSNEHSFRDSQRLNSIYRSQQNHNNLW